MRCKRCGKSMGSKDLFCRNCGAAAGTSKGKTPRRILIYCLSLLSLFVLAHFILPADGNGDLIWSQWYRPIIVFVPFLIAAFYDKLHLIRKSTKNKPESEIQYDLPELKQQSEVDEKQSENDNKLSYVEKERIMVQRVKTEDMLQFTEIQYDLNCPIHKFMKESGHPFAYMDLNSHNRKIAKNHLEQLNEIIDYHRNFIPLLTKRFRIDISVIAFHQYSKSYGYTRLMCTPYTFAGNVSKIPLTLHFMTRLDKTSYQVSGTIFYEVDGCIQKAEAHIWFRDNMENPATGWSFYFSNIDGELILEQAKTTLQPDQYGLATAVYKCQSLIEYEQEKDRDIQSFQWLQKNLPSKCPKSFSGYRRMKTQNTKNYQNLIAEAAKLGKTI